MMIRFQNIISEFTLKMFIRSIVLVSAISGSHAIFNEARQKYQDQKVQAQKKLISAKFENVYPGSMVLLDHMYYKVGEHAQTHVSHGADTKLFQVQGVQTRLSYCLKVRTNSAENLHEIQQEMHVYNTLKAYGKAFRRHNIPHVQNLQYGGVEDDTSIFLMEDCLLPTLRQRLSQPISEAEALTILKQLSQGLQVLHRDPNNIIIHGNLTPENILITNNNQLKIGGFDQAKVLTSGSSKTATGSMQYMAPEKFDFDTKTDLWSIGVMMYEILTGENPFGITKTDSEATIESKMESYMKQNNDHVQVQGVSDDMQQLIAGLTRGSPAMRMSALEFFAAVEKMTSVPAGRRSWFR